MGRARRSGAVPQARRPRKSKAHRGHQHNIRVSSPLRRTTPESVVAHLGPTNSGKTHDALRFLAHEGRGAFGAPLRMLAREAYETMCEIAGEESVGLVTGEERINEEAPILCCTTEMVPRSGHVLVLDEAHWAVDRERGNAWTRLLAAGEYRHLRIVGSVDTLPLLRSAFGARLEVHFHERLGALEWCGSLEPREITDSTLVVAFSRRMVLYIAEQLRAVHGRDQVGVLYGAMPLDARRDIIDRVNSGALKIVVATDVVGHGLNMPIGSVLFAETEKFDGQERRGLHAWEAAQIAGRAGRYGHHACGRVGVLEGVNFIEADARLVRGALTARVEVEPGVMGYRRLQRACLGPDLSDLGTISPRRVRDALRAWNHEALRVLKRSEWLRVEDITPMLDRLEIVGKAASHIGLQRTWMLANAPLDADRPESAALLRAIIAELVESSRNPNVDALLDRAEHTATMRLVEAESAAHLASGVRWAAMTIPELAHYAERGAALEHAASARVLECLRDGREAQAIGECEDCGGPCQPWRRWCGCRSMELARAA